MLELSPLALGQSFTVPNLGGHKYGVRSVAFSPDGESIASGSYDRTICIWNAQDPFPSPFTTRDSLKGHTGPITSVAYSVSGERIESASADRTIRLWESGSGREVGRPLQGHEGYVNSVAFSPGVGLIASGSADKTVRLWDIRQQRPRPTIFKGHSNWVHSVAFSFYGARMASGSHDKTIRIWDIERGTSDIQLTQHTEAVCSIAFSPYGPQIVSGSEDQTVRLWDIRNGKPTSAPYKGHSQGVKCIALSPDGLYVASGSWDKTVRVWDVRTGNPVTGPFKKHVHWVNSVAFSPCGKSIVSGSEDCNVMIWKFLEEDLPEDYAEFPTSAIVDQFMQKATIGNFTLPSQSTSLSLSRSPDSTLRPRSVPPFHISDNRPTTGMEVKARQMSCQETFRSLVDGGCIDLSSEIDINAYSTIAIHGGAMGDIYKGRLRNGLQVAVKIWRAFAMPDENPVHIKRAMRETYYWSKVKHENIQELMGVVLLHNRLGMVSLWMENGNLRDYIRKNPSVNRYSLCAQVAAGVSHIHSNDMVHGDLKAINILVSEDGVAKLSDFGHSILSGCSLLFSQSTPGGGTLRWMAPELLNDDISAERSPKCDVYALGMTILETITGKLPYAEYSTDNGVLGALFKRNAPKRPVELQSHDVNTTTVWRMLLQCWDHNPATRPDAHQVWQRLSVLV